MQLATLPASWSRAHLSHLAAAPITNGLGEAAQDYEEGSVRYIRTTDIKNLHELDDEKRVGLPRALAQKALVQDGDLLMTAAGSLGTSYLCSLQEPASYAGYLVRFRANVSTCDPRFVAWWTRSRDHLDQIAVGAVRSTIDNFSAGKFRSMAVPMPPLAKQRAIADFLDREIGEIDALIEKQHELIALLRERRRSVIDTVLDTASGIENVPLRSAVDIQSGVTLGKTFEPRVELEEYPYLRVANVQTGYVDVENLATVRLPLAVAKRHRLRTGDVLITEGGDRTALARGSLWNGEVDPCLHQNHIYALRPHAERLRAEYLVYVLEGSKARKYFERTRRQTTNLSATNSSLVRAFRFTLPSLAQQDLLFEKIDRETARIDALIAKAEEFIALARERRSAVITAAVTGQIDVTAQNGTRAREAA